MTISRRPLRLFNAIFCFPTAAANPAAAQTVTATTGDYGLTFVHVGFARSVRDSVRVGVGATVSVDVELTPGGVNDSIIVTGAPVLAPEHRRHVTATGPASTRIAGRGGISR
jgi:hypothetical protein